ncbi:hypothetical protein [Phreatobacter stygius]|uniref:Phage tail protein n=1 Tax=Phreatobacter stygius TaxID=1940610 RepID=A0A4D7B771_9HYPH|nr:hypothetical protein [Phreatobacter stygius]QCI65526.1 hypothetical protein E8M01_15720 [Phreatobacter stygius]
MTELPRHHGTRIIRLNDDQPLLRVPDRDVIGVMGIDAATVSPIWELNKPVGLINDDADDAKIAALTPGSDLAIKINAIRVASGGQARIVAVRTAESTNANAATKLEETIANMVGNASAFTGWHAFKKAKVETGLTPNHFTFGSFTAHRLGDAKNPILAAIEPYCEARRGFVYADLPSTTREAAVAYRADSGSLSTILIDPRVKASSDTGTTVLQAASPWVLGMGMGVIANEGFHFSWSNRNIGGIVGTERLIDYDISDHTTEANFLNTNAINTIVRDQGFEYQGGLTAAEDRRWQFHPVVAARYAFEVMAATELKPVMDRPMTAPQVINTIAALDDKAKYWASIGILAGGRVELQPHKNPSAKLRDGVIRITYTAEEVPPIYTLEIESARDPRYLVDMVGRIVRALDSTLEV